MRHNLKLKLTVFLFILITTSPSCEKSDSCSDAFPPTAAFTVKENLGDTSFLADTVFRQNMVWFQTTRPYDSVTWKIGNDPAVFDKPTFELNFAAILGTIDVNLAAKAVPNQRCFPQDRGVYSGKKSLTIVEQFDKATLTISPLVGSYKGAFKNTPNDTFTVTINYFDSAKYNTSFTGTKNFYWISNMPKGYEELGSIEGQFYPELRNGMRPWMGYKCLKFGDLGQIKKGEGYGELKHDTLVIYYQNVQTGRNTFIGKRQ